MPPATAVIPGDIILARYADDGILDLDFGNGGRTITDLGGRDRLSSMTIQSGGKILVIGSAGDDLVLLRYTADGRLDIDFGGGRFTVSDFGVVGTISSAAVQADGQVVAVGQVGGNFTVIRHTPRSLPRLARDESALNLLRQESICHRIPGRRQQPDKRYGRVAV